NLEVKSWHGRASEMPDYVKAARYDVVIIDAPPRADEALSRAIIASSEGGLILVPARASALDLWAADETFALIRAAQETMKLEFRVMLSSVKSRASVTGEIRTAIEQMKLPMLSAGTHDRTAYAASLSSCQTIFEYDGDSGKASEEIKQIYDAVKKLLH